LFKKLKPTPSLIPIEMKNKTNAQQKTKTWTKPYIKGELDIKKTRGNAGLGTDGGALNTNLS